jgi:hypothetical protein
MLPTQPQKEKGGTSKESTKRSGALRRKWPACSVIGAGGSARASEQQPRLFLRRLADSVQQKSRVYPALLTPVLYLRTNSRYQNVFFLHVTSCGDIRRPSHHFRGPTNSMKLPSGSLITASHVPAPISIGVSPRVGTPAFLSLARIGLMSTPKRLPQSRSGSGVDRLLALTQPLGRLFEKHLMGFG